MSDQRLVVVGSGMFLFGLWLLSRPKCHRGCRTMAEHLVTHGVDELLAGLFA